MDITGKDVLITAISETVDEIVKRMASLSEPDINKIPYPESWTAAQLLRHVSKSINGMANAMGAAAETSPRDPGEKIPVLKKTFLDFEHKLKSPDFIIPEERIYQKSASIEELNNALELLKKNTDSAKLDTIVNNLPLGPVTKLEILHFVLYHTERHLHQMKKIVTAVQPLPV